MFMIAYSTERKFELRLSCFGMGFSLAKRPKGPDTVPTLAVFYDEQEKPIQEQTVKFVLVLRLLHGQMLLGIRGWRFRFALLDALFGETKKDFSMMTGKDHQEVSWWIEGKCVKAVKAVQYCYRAYLPFLKYGKIHGYKITDTGGFFELKGVLFVRGNSSIDCMTRLRETVDIVREMHCL